MTTYVATLAANVVSTAEQSAAESLSTAGYEDAVGMLSGINADIALLKIKMSALATAVGAGTTATNINNVVTLLNS